MHFYSNIVPPRGRAHVVPLDQRSFYLRGDGKRGSFAALQQALHGARVTGIEPLAKACLDFTARIEATVDDNLGMQLTQVHTRDSVHMIQLHTQE